MGVVDNEQRIRVIKIKPPKSNKKEETGPVVDFLFNINMNKYIKEQNELKIGIGTKISNILFSKNEKALYLDWEIKKVIK